MNTDILSYRLSTPLGEFVALQKEEYITGFLPSNYIKGELSKEVVTPLFKELHAQMDAYFLHRLKRFDLPLWHGVGGFSGEVLDYLSQIEYGDSLSYGEVAAKLGAPMAFRAVGNACSKNPICIIIPCHRVVAKSHIGGYALGLEVKRKLFALEGIRGF